MLVNMSNAPLKGAAGGFRHSFWFALGNRLVRTLSQPRVTLRFSNPGQVCHCRLWISVLNWLPEATEMRR